MRLIIDVATEVLTLASGMGKAKLEMTEKERVIRKYAETTIDVVKWITKFIVSLFIIKGIIIVVTGITWAYNIAIGVQAAMTGKLTKSIVASKTAMSAYRAVTLIVTAAQWAWNAAMLANPIGLIIIGVAALIALIVVIVKKYNDWGAWIVTGKQ